MSCCRLIASVEMTDELEEAGGLIKPVVSTAFDDGVAAVVGIDSSLSSFSALM